MKEELLKLKGEVVEKCPNTLFRVKLENEMTVLCTLNGKMRKNSIYVLVGDVVDVELSTYDFTKGRICFRYKK